MKQIQDRRKTRSLACVTPVIVFIAISLALAIPGVALGKKCEAPPCGKGDGGGGGYQVGLSSGLFTFTPLSVSLNRKGILVGAEPLAIEAPTDDAAASVWNELMTTCGGPLSTAPNAIFVDADDWSVYKNSAANISINLETIYLPNTGPIEKEIQIILRGVPGDDFLPEAGSSITFYLADYVIWGKPKGGPHSGWDTCYQSDSDDIPRLPDAFGEFELQIINQ